MIVVGMDHFLSICKKKLVEWYNEAFDNMNVYIQEKIDLSQVYVVWSCKTLQNYKALLSTAVSGDGNLCGVHLQRGQAGTVHGCVSQDRESEDYGGITMKKKRTRKPAGGIMAATTTSRDWGHGPVAGKGGKTTNSGIGDTMIHRELKDQKRN